MPHSKDYVVHINKQLRLEDFGKKEETGKTERMAISPPSEEIPHLGYYYAN